MFSGVVACAVPQKAPLEDPKAPLEPDPIVADFLIENVRLFDGERVWENTSVAVRGDKIIAVGSNLDLGKVGRVFDGVGKTLMPGLIDSHTHIQGPRQLRQALVFGVTTEFDMFTTPEVFKPLRKIVNGRGGSAYADFRTAGILATAPGGHGTEYGFPIPTLSGPEEAERFVDARVTEGSDYLKIVLDDGTAFGRSSPTLDLATARALIGAAHSRGMQVIAHVSSQDAAISAIDAGVDGLAHVFLIALQPSSSSKSLLVEEYLSRILLRYYSPSAEGRPTRSQHVRTLSTCLAQTICETYTRLRFCSRKLASMRWPPQLRCTVPA